MTDQYLIIDEIPSLIDQGIVDGDPPGRIVLLEEDGTQVFVNESLKMPYDAVRTSEGQWLVNIIRERAVFWLSSTGELLSRIEVGGYPCSIQQLENSNILIAAWDDDKPGFVREFDLSGKLVWSHENLKWPWKAERLGNGNTLIAEAGQCRVFEVTPEGEEVWQIDKLGPAEPVLFDRLGPVYVQRLTNGNTLVSIRGESRICEFETTGDLVWELSAPLIKKPYSAIRLDNGNTLIADQGHCRVIEVDQDKNIVWQQGDFGYPAKAYKISSD